MPSTIKFQLRGDTNTASGKAMVTLCTLSIITLNNMRTTRTYKYKSNTKKKLSKKKQTGHLFIPHHLLSTAHTNSIMSLDRQHILNREIQSAEVIEIISPKIKAHVSKQIGHTNKMENKLGP